MQFFESLVGHMYSVMEFLESLWRRTSFPLQCWNVTDDALHQGYSKGCENACFSLEDDSSATSLQTLGMELKLENGTVLYKL